MGYLDAANSSDPGAAAGVHRDPPDSAGQATDAVDNNASGSSSESESSIATLTRLLRNFSAQHERARANLEHIVHVWLSCWKFQVSAKEVDSPERVPAPIEMLHWILERTQNVRPSLTVFATLLDGLVADRKSKDRARDGEAILEAMTGAAAAAAGPEGSIGLAPEEIVCVQRSYHKVMAMHGMEKNPAQAERLLREMQLHRAQIPLTSETYTIVVSAYCKSQMPSEAQSLMRYMLDQNIVPIKENFESCLDAWATPATTGKVAGENAEILLLLMLELHESGCAPVPLVTINSVARTVQAWVNSRRKDSFERATDILLLVRDMEWATPDVVRSDAFRNRLCSSAVLVMKKWSRSKAPQAPERCTALVKFLDEIVGGENIPRAFRPKMRAAHIVAWARSGRKDQAERVEKIVAIARAESSGDPLPLEVYHAWFQSLSNAGEGRRAEFLLKAMLLDYVQAQEKGVEGPPPPDIKIFNSVLIAWSNSRDDQASDRAEKLFLQMRELESSEHFDLNLDVVSYNALLSAMARTPSVEMARRGDAYFEQLKSERAFQATTVSYNEAIQLWSKVNSEEALTRADELLNEMRQGGRSIQPDRASYAAYLCVLKNNQTLPQNEREDRIAEIKNKTPKFRPRTRP
jgi:pentatricopeptide repeat protein